MDGRKEGERKVNGWREGGKGVGECKNEGWVKGRN